SQGTVIVVVTSQHSASRRQAQALQAAGARTWSPSLAQLADANAWRDWSAQVCESEAAASGTGTLLLLAPEGRRADLESDVVAARLVDPVGLLIQGDAAAGEVAAGGDGARAVLAALQAGGNAPV